ncbi:MAG TPA: serine hydrolase [Cellvibrionaceae bacterium]|nr:serine hydrolase [Cellvibrionaceae bacterium]HMW72787.1 serine hydrolase [Cellvibrionaceae bacterium]HNG59073.1 serine hydrolase [Cellvibrionaceae bacterium]
MKKHSFQTACLALVSTLALNNCLLAAETSEVSREQVDNAVKQLTQDAANIIEKGCGASNAGGTQREKAGVNCKIPGLAVAVVYKDEVLYAGGFGVREINTVCATKNDSAAFKAQCAVNADTVFQLASVSKPISASVVAALISQKRITWDSKLADLTPEFHMYDPWVTSEITIRDMFSHRSGLPKHANDLLEDLDYGRAAMLSHLRFIKPASSFRSTYAYTNAGLTQGAIAAATAYGLDWADAAEQTIYKPLGMASTSSRFKDFMARPNKATNHMLVDGQWRHKEQRNPDAQSPAGGVSSSVNDLTKWMRMELNKGKFENNQVVAEEPLAETQFPQIVSGKNHNHQPTFYGLGWGVAYDEQKRTYLSHSGGFALGAATHLLLIPEAQLGLVVLTNAAPIGVAEGLAKNFTDSVFYGKPQNNWLHIFTEVFKDPKVIGIETLSNYTVRPTKPTPAQKNSAYSGRYGNNPWIGDVVIEEHNGKLALIIGPNAKKLPLSHFDRDTFTFATVGENAAGLSGVTFTMGADGKAQSLLIESLNQQGQGQLARLP